MFKNKKIKYNKERHFDCVGWSDPIAEKVLWSSVLFYKDYSPVYKVTTLNQQEIRFCLTIVIRIFNFIIFLLGVGLIFFSIKGNVSDGSIAVNYPLLMFGAVCLFTRLYNSYLFKSQLLFDKQDGYFRKGKSSFIDFFRKEPTNIVCALKDIHALQLIKQEMKTYDGYEIIIISKDAERFHVVSHCHDYKVKGIGQLLSKFLGVPLWDAT